MYKAARSKKGRKNREKRKIYLYLYPVFVFKTQGRKPLMNIWHMHMVLWCTLHLADAWL